MQSLQEDMKEYRKQLSKGVIQKAYLGLMEYIMDLRTYFASRYPQYFVSGSIYYGYMDMTHFSFFPESIKSRKLKIAIVYIHNPSKFEVWLSGYNKGVQTSYLKQIKETHWDKYTLAPAAKGIDYIIAHTSADNPDFSDLAALTRQIESGALAFTKDIEDYFSKHDN